MIIDEIQENDVACVTLYSLIQYNKN